MTGALAGVGGYSYWLFCVYRIHKILAEYTQGKYPIAAWKSVAFHFIPLFSVYWIFKWPGTLANFVNSRPSADGTGRRMRRWLPAVALFIASLMTPLFGLKAGVGFQLLLVFAVGLYMTRNLKRVVPCPEPISLRQLEQLKVSASVGIGAAFSLILFDGLLEFFSPSYWTPEGKAHELVTIGLVSAGVTVFMEPLFEKLRLQLGIAHDHPFLEPKRSLWLRLTVFVTLYLASLLHSIAETATNKLIEQLTAVDPWEGERKIVALASALLISGVITGFWIGAANLRRPGAARSGALTGAASGVVVSLMVLSSLTSARTGAISPARGLEYHFAFPGMPPVVAHYIGSEDFSITVLVFLSIPWMLMGFAGGAVIDKRWARGSAGNLAFNIVGAAIVAGLSGHFVRPGWIPAFSYLPAATGWTLALIACSSSRILGLEEARVHSDH